MKKSFLILALAAMTAGVACTDLSEVEGRIDTLETEVAGINATLKTIQDNLKNSVSVSKVEPSADGYTIYFTNGTTAVIKNGKDGATGATGAQGEKGENGAPGKDGDSLFASVEVKDGFVTLTLADGSVMVLPMAPTAVGMINAMTYVPEFNDGKATIVCTSPEAATVELDFAIAPYDAAAAFAEDFDLGKTEVNVWAIPVKTRASSEETIDLPVKSVAFHGALMTVAVDASPALSAGDVAICVSLSDEKSEFFAPVVPAVKEVRYITYAGETYGFAKMKDGKTWMTENLRYIPEGKEISAKDFSTNTGIWYPATLTINGTAATAVADDSSEGIKAKGLLYSEEVAMGGKLPATDGTDAENIKGICPDGWHIPTLTDWTHLAGACSNAAHQYLDAPYYDATAKGAPMQALDADGFNCVPSAAVNGGTKYMNTFSNKADSPYYQMPSMAYFASSTGRSATQSYAAMITNNATYQRMTVGYNNLTNGVSVRCVKD